MPSDKLIENSVDGIRPQHGGLSGLSASPCALGDWVAHIRNLTRPFLGEFPYPICRDLSMAPETDPALLTCSLVAVAEPICDRAKTIGVVR